MAVISWIAYTLAALFILALIVIFTPIILTIFAVGAGVVLIGLIVFGVAQLIKYEVENRKK